MADSENDKDAVIKGLSPPKAKLEVNFTTWPAGKPVHRVHSRMFSALQFNPGRGNARFSPMSNGVATLYGGASIDVAVMETVFHDLPADSAGVPFDKGKLADMVYSEVIPASDLTLVDLNPRTLRKMGVSRADLLDSSADRYPLTRKYSLAIHHSCPLAQGLQWSSRQHGDLAIMLFGDRVDPKQLVVLTESVPVTDSAFVMDSVEELADQLGVVLLVQVTLKDKISD